jgi:hypothetical protein
MNSLAEFDPQDFNGWAFRITLPTLSLMDLKLCGDCESGEIPVLVEGWPPVNFQSIV